LGNNKKARDQKRAGVARKRTKKSNEIPVMSPREFMTSQRRRRLEKRRSTLAPPSIWLDGEKARER